MFESVPGPECFALNPPIQVECPSTSNLWCPEMDALWKLAV